MRKFQLFSALFSALLLSNIYAGFKEDAVIQHNIWRNALNNGEIQGQPLPVPFLKNVRWDDNLAGVAQAHTNKCIFAHSGGGENLYAHSGSGSIIAGINAWGNEVQDYTYRPVSVDSTFFKTGHYTQVIWDSSTQIGCGVTTCSNIYDKNGIRMFSGKLYNCRYSSPGNRISTTPYRITPYTDEVNAIYDPTTYSVEIPFITYNGNKFRAKLERIGEFNTIWDFRVVAYEHIGESFRTDVSTLIGNNGTFELIIELDMWVAYLHQIHPGTLDFRLTNLVEK